MVDVDFFVTFILGYNFIHFFLSFLAFVEVLRMLKY